MIITSTFSRCLALVFSLVFGSIHHTLAQEAAPNYDKLIQGASESRNTGDMESAESILRQAHSIASNKSEAAYLLGLVVAFQGRYQEATQIIETALLDYPEDLNLALAKARVLSYQGLYSEAEKITAAVLEASPQNEDAINLSARIALYQQRPEFAKAQLEALLQRQPENLEAIIALHDAQLALGDEQGAEQALRQASTIAPEHVDVLSRQGIVDQPGVPKNSISAGFAHSKTDSQSFDWDDRFIQYARQYSRNSEQSFRLSHSDRFGLSDTSISTELLLRKTSRTPFFIALQYTPNADFLAKTSLSAGTSFRLSEGGENMGATLLSPNIRVAEYQSGTVKSANINLEYYLKHSDAWLSLGTGTVIDENDTSTTGFNVSANWQYSARSRIGVSHYDGAETENTITRKSRSTNAYWVYDLSSSLSTRWDIGRTNRSNSKPRSNFSFSVQYRY
ncbi:MAG: tetratricopeptide repeat protein [Pseudohongiellaceae bacterium]|nr:tetratricopeptide repeat protein [Pseudohongiellaceae bacterium]